MTAGFDRLSAEMRQIGDQSRQFLEVRNDISRLEQRMLRRFDDVDERLGQHEVRIAALEARK